jgi:hypothetical protein
MQADHIAVLVNSIEAVQAAIPESCTSHELKEQPTEGTLEQYITFGDDKTPALILMQAVAEGPYKMALEKRGTGLHHIGCVCGNIDEELASGAAKQMLIHPISLKTIKRGTIWLYRPGTPYLIELMENEEQNVIRHSKVLLMLPAPIYIPEYASEIPGNLVVKNSSGGSIVLKISGIEMKFDPKMG